jgi:ankyrin repeat protein
MRALLRVKRSKDGVWSTAFTRRYSRKQAFRLKAVLQICSMIRKKHFQLLIVGILLGLCACAEPEPGSDQPTPEAARRFLKLRGYNIDDETFLSAAKAGDEMAVNGFIAAGINPNAKDENGDTALTAAAARGDLQIARALLRDGADVNAVGRNNWTALLLAFEDERDEVAEALINQPGLDLKSENPSGMTALMLAVWHRRAGFVKKLLQRGADSNHQDKDGDTAVHGAAWFGSSDILEMLLSAGADPNVKNKLGGTALMWAASYGQDESVRILLDKGADPRIKDMDGVTAAGWAAKNGQGNLVMLLREAEKKRQGAEGRGQ